MDNELPSASKPQPSTPESVSPVATPSAEKSKPYGRNWKKWILIYLAIGLLIYAGVYHFVLSKQTSKPYSAPITKTEPSLVPTKISNPTAGWKIYQDPTLLFSFKYPSAWKVVKEYKNFPSDADVFTFTSPDFSVTGGLHGATTGGAQLAILTQQNGNFKTYEEFKSFLENSASGQTKGFDRQQDIKVNGVQTLLLTDGDHKNIRTAAYTFYNGRTWEFLLKSNQNRDSLFNQILSTIKFTEPAQTVDAGGLKTYTSQSGKFSLKYPSDYKLIENRQSSADGVIADSPNSIEIISPIIPGVRTNFSLVTKFKNEADSSVLEQLITKNKTCASIDSTAGVSYILDGQRSLIFKDTTCGLSGSTIIYSLNNGVFYEITISSGANFTQIGKYADSILTTFKFTQ